MSKDLFWGLLLFLTLAQWIIYAKVKEWWRERNPEPEQHKAVDRVLYHLLTDKDLPWDAGESWERHGRAYIVSLERQGLNRLLNEYDVGDFKASYTLGYCVREEADRKEIAKLQKRLQRHEDTNKRLTAQIDDLKEQLRRKPEPAPVHVAEPTRPKDPLQEAWEEWGASPDGIDTIMQRKGWVRIAPAAVAVTVPEDVEDSTQSVEPEEPTTDYKALKGKDKIDTMLRLKAEGMSNGQIAQLFGMTTGGVKGIISKNKPRPDNIVTLDFGVSEKVSTGN